MHMHGYGTGFRAPKIDIHKFTMIPRADIPRSAFTMQHQHKTTISCTELIPVYLQEVLPGDSFNVSMSAFCRLATPLFPILDNLDLESFFFFVPNRLVWVHWQNFQGEQNNPADPITYVIPQIVSPVGGFAPLSIYDYFGLPTSTQTAAGNTISVSALPLRAYNLIYQEWFRDENLVNARATGTAGGLAAGAKWWCQSDDGPDPVANYATLFAAKRHDYFTACLPWTQKGATAVTLPLGTSATVRTNATDLVSGAQTPVHHLFSAAGTAPTVGNPIGITAGGGVTGQSSAVAGFVSAGSIYPSNLYADLSTATAATINSIRLAFQTQRLLERDARGGTRYTEILRSHWGVTSPDQRLQRPEYLGGGKTPIIMTPVPQTTATGLTGGTSPIGTLSAAGMATAHHGFRQAFTEHGHIIGLVCVRNDKIYQQGIRRLWSRSTRYDFYMPVFAMLGEQAVLNKEIFSDGSANDALTFGYQERWAEYRYHPSYTTAYFNSTNATPLDAWHLAQKFTSLPALNATFINDDLTTTIQRNLAAGASSNHQQLLCDFFFHEKVARAMPMYSVPGMVDHF
jgi:hypothetical protein